MIRIEIISNQASSDTGLQNYPSLQDLADTLLAQNLDARFVRYAYRTESDINLASGKHARGVTVRSKAVRESSPEGNLRGLTSWLRVILARPERALHLHLENPRATNGTGLILSHVYQGRHKVFLSGLDSLGWLRLLIPPDLSGKTLPAEIAQQKALMEEYQARGTRVTTFIASVRRLAELNVVSPEWQPRLAELITPKGPEALKTWTPAMVVNLGMIQDGLERYERLVEQFCALMAEEDIQPDLVQLFDLLVRGMTFSALRNALLPFVLEDQKEEAIDLRSLLNTTRVGLNNAPPNQRDSFLRVMLGLVVRHRLVQDPPLYRNALTLRQFEPSLVEALGQARRQFLEWDKLYRAGLAKLGPKPEGSAKALLPVAQGIFEFAVNMIFQARFTQPFRDGQQPASVVVARNMISCFTFDRFDLQRLRNLHPNLPARGVATNLAVKVQPTLAEVARVRQTLWEALFPLNKPAQEISRTLHARYKTAQDQRKLAEVSAFLLGSHTLVGATNYVLDREGANPLLRRAALDGGRALGMVVLSSRDQIRNSDVLARLRQGEDVQAEGYVILMHRATDHWFPLLADADHILRTYRYLIRQRVANLVHRFIANRLNHLMTTYGAGVFDLMYDHLCWRHRLGLSKAQLAALLIQDKVFDAGRLKELGFDPRAEKTSEGHNPWLILDEGKDEKSHQEFEAAWKKVSEALAPLLVRGAKEPAEGAQKPRALRTVLAALAAEEVFDPTDPRAQEALKSTQEAEYLSAVLQSLLETVPELFEGAAVESDESSGGDYYLTGPLAYLALLKEGHGLTGAQGKVSIRLLSARDRQGEHLDEGSRALAMQLTAALQSHSAGAALRGAIDTLRGWEVRWRHASQVGALFMIEQALRETVLSLAKPHPPLIQDLAGVPDEELLCLGSSLGDLNKFKRVITRSDRKDAFATLSEFASWLIRFERLREELERYRDLTEEITRIITGFQLSAFDAPHLHRYTMDMKALGALLDIRPEEMTAAHLTALEEKAMATVQVIHEIHEMERPLMLRDRWLSRTGMKLRQLYPHVELTFIHTLFERRRGGATEEGAPVRKPGEGGSSEFQTFSQRVRDVIAVRDRLENKRVFVLSPNNTQEKLTLSLLEQLQRLKGVTTPIFVDISGCESFADALRTRVPPYRLVDLNTL